MKIRWDTTQRQDLLSCLGWGECWSVQGKTWHYFHTPHWTARRLPGGHKSPLPSSHLRALFSYKLVKLPSFAIERYFYSASPCKCIFIWKSETFFAGDCIHLQWEWLNDLASLFHIWQNINLIKMDYLLIIFPSTSCYLRTTAWCMKPHTHGKGINSDEKKATPEVLQWSKGATNYDRGEKHIHSLSETS